MKNLLFAALFLMSNGAFSAQVQSENCNTHCEFISLLIHQVAAGRDEVMRGELANSAAVFFENNPQCGADPNIVKEIAKFLNDKNDGVIAGAAQALANIGAPAKGAIPDLEQALRHAQEKIDASDSVMLPSLSAADVIRNALEHIKGPAGARKQE